MLFILTYRNTVIYQWCTFSMITHTTIIIFIIIINIIIVITVITIIVVLFDMLFIITCCLIFTIDLMCSMWLLFTPFIPIIIISIIYNMTITAMSSLMMKLFNFSNRLRILLFIDKIVSIFNINMWLLI